MVSRTGGQGDIESDTEEILEWVSLVRQEQSIVR